jgi:ribosomal protein S18 acetylase RimI-like enzyme
MSQSLSIQEYHPEYREHVLELHEVAMRNADAFIEGVTEPDLVDIEESYVESTGTFLLGLRREELVAMGAFRPATGYITEFLDVSEGTAELKRMRVDPAHQRNGYGQALYDELERRMRAAGFDEVVLDTTPQQEAARAFYRTNGFELAGRETVEAEGQSFELLLYRKAIGSE